MYEVKILIIFITQLTGGHTSAHEDCERCTGAATNMVAAHNTVDRYIHILIYNILSYQLRI